MFICFIVEGSLPGMLKLQFNT